MCNLTAWMRLLPNSRIILTDLQKSSNLQACLPSSVVCIHTSSHLNAFMPPGSGPNRWPAYNKKNFPPQAPDEERRPAVSNVVT